MKIVAIKEKADSEVRCAITPETTKLFVKKGYNVWVEKGIGEQAGFDDQEYIDAGAKLSSVIIEILSDADIILKVQPSLLNDKFNEIEFGKNDSIIIGMLSPYHNQEYIKKIKTKHLHGISMELLPRITKTQSMDVLSSQSNLAGYRAVIEAMYHFTKSPAMMMTAAGSLAPAKVLVLGVGVAGLQAIATAKRLGAIVCAYDVRKATKEQVESLGAKFVTYMQEIDDMENKSGYAKENNEAQQIKQEEFLMSIVASYDIIITTAQVPNKKAPILITEKMLKILKKESIIVDMAVSSGGNVEHSKNNKIVEYGNTKIIGYSNFANKVASDASKLYAKNLYNFVDYAVHENKFNLSDEIVKSMIVTV